LVKEFSEKFQLQVFWLFINDKNQIARSV